ncbi:MAG: DNA-3-methyladenine glycosylase I [Acidobacteriota bacterium]
MEEFEQIYARAVIRHGGEDAVDDQLSKPKSSRSLQRLGDDRFLSAMARCIFRSGFVWRVVEAKWPGFEAAFRDFDPAKVAKFGERQLDRLKEDQRIIRNGKKIESVRDNARFVLSEAKEHGSFAKFIARWPSDDVVGLWLHLKKHGSRLGGNTGPMFLRTVGKDTFILSNDIVDYLVNEGIVAKNPTGKADLYRVQEAFNSWAEESGRPLCQVSRVVSMSWGEVFEW